MLEMLERWKISAPPVGPGRVNRPGLEARLDGDWEGPEGFRRALTLVCAPAGYGKTTAVRAWLGEDRPVAWVNLEEEDGDPLRFWTLVAGAVARVLPDAGGQLGSLFASRGFVEKGLFPVPAVLDRVLEILEASGQSLVLVLDDGHRIRRKDTLDTLRFLVEHLPVRVHLVLISRSHPDWPLARWQAVGRLLEIRPEDLGFSLPETGALWEARGVRATEEAVCKLVRETGGWPLGLQLAGRALESGMAVESVTDAFSGTEGHGIRLLTERLLAGMDDGTRGALVACAVVSRLTAELWEELTGRENDRARLEALLGEGFWVREETGGWFGMHPLLRRALLEVFLDGTLDVALGEGPGDLEDLRGRAGRWLERDGAAGLALDLALEAGEGTRVAGLLDRWLDELWAIRGPEVLARRMDRLPAEAFREFGCLVPARAMLAHLQGDRETARAWLARGSGLSFEDPECGERFEAMDSLVRARMDADDQRWAQAARRLGRTGPLLNGQSKLWQNAAGVLGADVRARAGDLDGALSGYRDVAGANLYTEDPWILGLTRVRTLDCLLEQGRLLEAEEEAGTFLAGTGNRKTGRMPLTGLVHGLSGEALRRQGRLEEAGGQMKTGLETARPEEAVLARLQLLAAGLSVSQGRFADARESLSGMQETVQGRLPEDRTLWRQARLLEIRMLTAEGQTDRAREMLEAMGAGLEAVIRPLEEGAHLALVRCLLREHRPDLAGELLARLEHVTDRRDRPGLWVEIRILTALLRQASGKEEEALDSLGEALEAARPHRECQLFVDEGPVLHRLLGELDGDHPQVQLAMDILTMVFRQHPVFPKAGADRPRPKDR